jgi:hypothetical protein
MSLLDRQKKYRQLLTDRTAQEQQLENSKPPIQLFPQPRYGIVDGELVEAYGQDNIQGMSPATWCRSLTTGAVAPVPIDELPLFDSIGHALAVQEQQRGVGASTRR